MNNAKLIKSVSIIDKILKVIQGFTIAGIVISVIFIPLTVIFGEKVIASSNTLELGALSLKYAEGVTMNNEHAKVAIILMLAMAIIGCIIGWYGIRVLRSVLKPIKEGRPFEHGISEKIRRLAWVYLIGGAIIQIGSAVEAIIELSFYDLGKFFDASTVISHSYNVNVDLNFVVVAVVLFVLSYVFSYGEQLQQESDETL